MKNIKVGASVICMNPLSIEQDIIFCEKIGVDYFHLDIMDGTYVPRFGLYPEIVKEMSKVTDLRFDLHLMVEDLKFVLDQFLPCENINLVSFHLEGNEGNLYKIVDQIKSYNVSVGIVINLSTSLDHVAQIINDSEIDSIMFMGIHPGVLIQKHRPLQVLKNIENLVDRVSLPSNVQCDGAVNFDTIPSFAKSGINSFVCGSSTLFKNIDLLNDPDEKELLISQNMEKIRSITNGI